MKLLVAFVFISFAILLCISCNTVRKNRQSAKSSTDSTHVSKAETTATAHLDSSGTKSEHGGYEKETVYEYDTVYRVVKGDLVRVYVPRIVKVYENGTFTKRETAAKKSSDSVALSQVDSTRVMRTSEAKSLEKKSLRMPIGLIIGGAVALVLIACFAIYLKNSSKANTWIN